MLFRQNRLKKKKDFEVVFKTGKGFKQGFLFFKLTENGLNENRFGFVVSHKISKKAVVRNQIKRRLREIVRHNSGDRLKKGFDCVLVALPGLENASFQEMRNMINSIFKKANIIKND